jgi:hypothetical protein
MNMDKTSRFGRSLRIAVGSSIAAAGLVFATVQPADAATFRYQVASISKGAAHTVGPKVFATCKILTTGGVCTISRGRSASREIALSLGVSRGTVASGLSISSAKSVSVAVSCASPPLRAGQSWKAKAMGRYYHYNVRKQQGIQGRTGILGWRTVATSARLTAFNPASNEIACGL